jgi:adenylate kinase family enzyme
MIFEGILMICLIATLVAGIRLYFNLQQLKVYKYDFDKVLNKAESQLTDLEKIIERFRFITTSEKDTFQRITDKAKTIKEDLMYLTEKSENILQALSSTSQSIKVDAFVTESLTLDTSKHASSTAIAKKITTKKNKLMNTIKDLR